MGRPEPLTTEPTLDIADQYAAQAADALNGEYDRHDDEAILLHGILSALLAIYHRMEPAKPE